MPLPPLMGLFIKIGDKFHIFCALQLLAVILRYAVVMRKRLVVLVLIFYFQYNISVFNANGKLLFETKFFLFQFLIAKIMYEICLTRYAMVNNAPMTKLLCYEYRITSYLFATYTVLLSVFNYRYLILLIWWTM